MSPETAIEGVARVAQPIAYGVGRSVIGPALGGALASDEVRAGVWRVALPVGAVIAGSVALGVMVGLWLGRR